MDLEELLLEVAQGNRESESHLYRYYVDPLRLFVRRRIELRFQRVFDEDDVCQLVFEKFFAAARTGQFVGQSRDEVWWFLLALAKRVVVDLTRRESSQKRGDGRLNVLSESEDVPSASVEHAIDTGSVEPSYIAAIAEEYEKLSNSLRDERLRKIAQLRIEGFTVFEIASELGISVRSIERKLQLIRKAWSSQILPSDF